LMKCYVIKDSGFDEGRVHPMIGCTKLLRMSK
jgi:hypothetical protein